MLGFQNYDSHKCKIVHWTKQLRIGLNDNNFLRLHLNAIKNGNTRDKEVSHMEKFNNSSVFTIRRSKRREGAHDL